MMNRLLQATLFAATRHVDQRRKNRSASPYINHPIEVADHLTRVGRIDEPEILIAALLHDTIEDTATTDDEIRELFGSKVVDLVLECTDDKSLAKAERSGSDCKSYMLHTRVTARSRSRLRIRPAI